MNNQETYRQQVALLLRIMPHVSGIKEFAIHGGTAINLFYKNMPRYSVDIDITYIPIEEREISLRTINNRLAELKLTIEKHIPGVRVIHKTDVWKLLCSLHTATVKIEVNGTKRGTIGDIQDLTLCKSAQINFHTMVKAHVVSTTQLYGGKLAAALSRQHPRDLFDFCYMDCTFDEVRDGLLLALLGSDKPIVESLEPHDIDQKTAIDQQFEGMAEVPFTYADYEQTRNRLHGFVNGGLTETDRNFLLSFEKGSPDWSLCTAGDLGRFPAVQWKLQNIRKLKKLNPKKYEEGIEKLGKVLGK